NLDLEAGVARADLGLERRELRVAGLLAPIDGDELIRIRTELAQRLVHDLGVVAAGELEAVVDETDDVALPDAKTVASRVADGVGDLDRLDTFGLGPHRFQVFGGRTLRPKRDYGRHSLRHAVRLDDVHLLLGQSDDLLGRRDHVAVVREQDHLVVGQRVDRGKHVLRARIHRLAALDDRVDPKPAKDVHHPATGDNGDQAHAVGPGRLGRPGGALAVENSSMLRRHVADADLHELAVATGQVDDPGRVVGVDVDFHQLGLADDEHRVAQRLDLASYQLGVEVAAFDEELGAVAPAALGKVECDLRGGAHRLTGFGQRGQCGVGLLDG